MKFLDILTQSNVNLHEELKPKEVRTIESSFDIDTIPFEMKITIECTGSLHFTFNTPISPFSRSFAYQYEHYRLKDNKFRIIDDFSLNVCDNSLENIITMSKFNLMLAEFFLELEQDKKLQAVLQKNGDAFYTMIKEKEDEERKKAVLEKEEREKNFNEKHRFLTKQEINAELKALREQKEDSYGFNEYPQRTFKTVDSKFNTLYVMVYYNDGKIHMATNYKEEDLKIQTRYQGAAVREVKDRLERAYI